MHITNPIEKHFFKLSEREKHSTTTPYIVVSNFPTLGLLTSLRFIEWISKNPEGVISLPTGKTPEHFIKWTKFFLNNWNSDKARSIREDNGLFLEEKPQTSGLHFVQMDEFYPIDPNQRNSFYYYINEYYIKGFNLDPRRALLINSEDINFTQGLHYSEIFPNNTIDLSLRYRQAANSTEAIQQKAIYEIDNWCLQYENKIRNLGGIGFFLCGIGSDGHIAFNIRGSSHHSTTRLTSTNFETQAASASDLGGIEISRKRPVITIGLGTITYNKNIIAITFAAGEAKANTVKENLENETNVLYPVTALQALPNSRFYITEGAASALSDSVDQYYRSSPWNFEKTERAISDLCVKLDKYAHKLTLDDLKNDKYAQLIPNVSLDIVNQVILATESKITNGLKKEKNQRYLHTGPHHDDIMLGIFPVIIQQLREASNTFHFAVLTSGFTAVTNKLFSKLLLSTKDLLLKGNIEMVFYPDFFDEGYKYKRDKDVAHYLNQVAAKDEQGQLRGICHRITRILTETYKVKSITELTERIDKLIDTLQTSYDGQKNPADIQQLKGMIREFEEELVWAHYGVQVKDIEHLRLGFYTGDVFTKLPEKDRDVQPILNMLRRIQPTNISLAFDPEGSGPDTHYKVLQAIAEAVRLWGKEYDTSNVTITGYRNVWFKFHPAEASVFTPVSLNSMAVLNSSFKNCYISQVEASFPSPDFDGPFSELSQKIWVEQFKKVQLLLGKNFFYEHKSPKMRTTHGMIFHKEMKVDDFLQHARKLEKSTEGITA